jgi:type IV secretion system protein VirB3
MARAVDTLYVAMTRPPMRWGVPVDALLANAAFTTFATMLVIHRPPGFLLGVAVHFLLRELCRIDPHFFGKWRLWCATKARSTTGVIWGGSYLAPSRLRIRSARELASSV